MRRGERKRAQKRKGKGGGGGGQVKGESSVEFHWSDKKIGERRQ